jgi:putative transport protein
MGGLIGKVKIKSFTVGSTGFLIAAMVCGKIGFSIPGIFKDFGLVLFLYTTSIQVGGGFFASLRSNGLKFNFMVAVSILVTFFAMIGMRYIFDIDIYSMLGVFNGSMLSSAGLAALLEEFGKIGVSDQSTALASGGYIITYLVTSVMILVFLEVMPRFTKISIVDEKNKHDQKLKDDFPNKISVSFVLENEKLAGLSIRDASIKDMTGGATISRIQREKKVYIASPDFVLQAGDEMVLVGDKKMLEKAEIIIGKTTQKHIPYSSKLQVSTILVTNKKIANTPIKNLSLNKLYGAVITRIRRGSIDLTPTADLRVQYGDRLIVVAPSKQIPRLSKLIGNSQRALALFDFIPFALGIVLGVMLGAINIHFPFGGSLKLGSSAGVLIVGLILSSIGQTGNVVWRIPETANRILKDFGIALFFAAIGTSAGSFLSVDFILSPILAIGFVLSLTPMLTIFIMSQYVFKENYLKTAGAICGSLECITGLGAVCDSTKTNAPFVTYAMVFPLALILKIILMSFVSLFL